MAAVLFLRMLPLCSVDLSYLCVALYKNNRDLLEMSSAYCRVRSNRCAKQWTLIFSWLMSSLSSAARPPRIPIMLGAPSLLRAINLAEKIKQVNS